MNRSLYKWYSPNLKQEMPIATYGHYGFSLLLIPTAAADYLEYERFNLIEALSPLINAGKLKVYSVDSINNQSWMHQSMEGAHKAIRQNEWNQYIFEEVIPYIKLNSGHDTPIYVAGASFGALHSMNLFLKRPDLFNGVIAMSGVYNLMEYTKGYYDEQVFFNSPAQYVPGLSDNWYLDHIRKSNHIHIFSGEGSYEDPHAARYFAGVLYNKNINYDLEVWGAEWPHDWQTWRTYLPYALSHKF